MFVFIFKSERPTSNKSQNDVVEAMKTIAETSKLEPFTDFGKGFLSVVEQVETRRDDIFSKLIGKGLKSENLRILYDGYEPAQQFQHASSPDKSISLYGKIWLMDNQDGRPELCALYLVDAAALEDETSPVPTEV